MFHHFLFHGVTSIFFHSYQVCIVNRAEDAKSTNRVVQGIALKLGFTTQEDGASPRDLDLKLFPCLYYFNSFTYSLTCHFCSVVNRLVPVTLSQWSLFFLAIMKI